MVGRGREWLKDKTRLKAIYDDRCLYWLLRMALHSLKTCLMKFTHRKWPTGLRWSSTAVHFIWFLWWRIQPAHWPLILTTIYTFIIVKDCQTKGDQRSTNYHLTINYSNDYFDHYNGFDGLSSYITYQFKSTIEWPSIYIAESLSTIDWIWTLSIDVWMHWYTFMLIIILLCSSLALIK